MSVADDFQAALERINGLGQSPPQADQLKLYGFYKQATQGDATGKRPGMTKVRDRAKFDAWAKNKGTSQEEAMRQYMRIADRLT